MKNPKTTIVLTLCFVAVVTAFLQSQQGLSQPTPPPGAQSFNAHYTEVNANLAAAGTSPSFSLPMLNRTIRLSVTFKTNDGTDVAFGEIAVLYNSTTGDYLINAGNTYSSSVWDFGGVSFVGGTNGDFIFQSALPAGSLHVGLWY